MRLFEVEDRFVNDLVMFLRNLIGRSDSQDANAQLTLTYPGLNNLLQNFGYSGIEPSILKNFYDENQDVQKLMKDPEETGEQIVLKTEITQQAVQATRQPGPDVDHMAKQGAQDYQSDISK